MTPQSPKAVTAEKYMQKIFTLLQLPMTYDSRNGIPKGAYESVTEQIKLAQEEGYRQGIKNATDPSRNDPKGMKSELSYLLKENYAKGFSDGQVAMRERAGKIADEYTDGYSSDTELTAQTIAERIRALHPHAPEEGN